VSFLEPEPDLKKIMKGKKAKGRGRRGKRTQLFIGDLEPLLLARRLLRRRRRRRSASPESDAAAEDGGNEDGDADANAVVDDDGVWPGEYNMAVPTIVVTEPEPEVERAESRITPEEVERAIGAAFAIAN